MAKFEKGKSGNPKGKPKGTENKITKQQKESIQWVMERLEDNILEDIKNVNASRRLQLYTDLMNYIKPKLSATKVDADVNEKSEVKIIIEYGNDTTAAPDAE